MNLFFVLIAIGVAATVAYYAYKWWTGPHLPEPGLADAGAFLIRSATMYGGYPVPFIYKKRTDDNYIVGIFDPSGGDGGIAQVTEKELRVLLTHHADKFDVLAPYSVDELGATFADAIRAFQAKALLSLTQTEPTDLAAREREIVSLTRRPEKVIADQIAFMADQLA